MWFTIIGLLTVGLAASFVFAGFQAARFAFVKKIAHGKKWLSRLLGFAVTGAVLGILYLTMGFMNTVVVFLHYFIFLVLSEVISAVVTIVRSKKRPAQAEQDKGSTSAFLPGLCAAVITVIYLCIAAFLDLHVFETDYSLKTDKQVGTLRVAMIADAHIGTTFGGKGFAEHMDKLMESQPDMLVICGDLVDNSAGRLDVEACCEKLGSLDLKYGVWYVEGNHDRGFPALEPWLELCGVNILKDESVLIDDRIYLIGRRDRGNRERCSMEQLVSGLDSSKYMIVLDHQPYDYDAEAASGADLVLSGHTHGGQMIPINHVGELIGENALRYGHERRENTDFIVTSGISDWELLFKTGCYSEFVIIDITTG